jgi:gluconolactonase
MEPSCRIEHDVFRDFVDTSIAPDRIAHGFRWTEGPVWMAHLQCLFFNDIPNRQMLRWREGEGVTVALANSEFANGNTTDLEGRMVSCEHGGRRVVRRTDPENLEAVEVLAAMVDGKRLNSPNDVVVKSDGSIWFTDPPYGIDSDIEGYQADSEIGGNHVYRIDPKGGLAAVATDFDRPNGLAFSPDESLLYVADSGAAQGSSFPGFDYRRPHHIRVLDVVPEGLAGSRVFAVIEPGVPDGLRVDTGGFVWTSAGDGIRCLSPQGDPVGRILLPEVASNCCFGGSEGRDLFITASSAVYRVRTTRKGAESLRPALANPGGG